MIHKLPLDEDRICLEANANANPSTRNEGPAESGWSAGGGLMGKRIEWLFADIDKPIQYVETGLL